MLPDNLTEEDKLNPYYNVRDIATLFKVKEYTARKWLRDGEIENVINPGGKNNLARRSDVLAFGQRKYGSS